VVACNRDLYFTLDDMAADVDRIHGASLHVIDSLLGHRAGNPHSSAPEQQQLRRIVEQLLAS
jgi:homoserine O-acetyltransferase